MGEVSPDGAGDSPARGTGVRAGPEIVEGGAGGAKLVGAAGGDEGCELGVHDPFLWLADTVEPRMDCDRRPHIGTTEPEAPATP